MKLYSVCEKKFTYRKIFPNENVLQIEFIHIRYLFIFCILSVIEDYNIPIDSFKEIICMTGIR